jgi:hypothetical protein
VKVAALLSWFDEDPAQLAEMVHSLARIDVDLLVAVDGRYATFNPKAPAHSDHEQLYAIKLAAGEAGIEYETHTPLVPWASEIAKRNFLFRTAELHKPDWYFVIDGDEVIPSDFNAKRHLEATDRDAAAVTLREAVGDSPLRMFFRAIPGLRVERNHHTYVTPDGRRLWGGHGMDPALDMLAMVVHHRPRSDERAALARAYYKQRDQSGLEMGNCQRGCGHVATHELPTDWHFKADGVLTSQWISVCDDCVTGVRIENHRTLESYGLDPAMVRVTFRRPDEVFA